MHSQVFDYSLASLERVLIPTLFVLVWGFLVSQTVLQNAATSLLVTVAKAFLFAACYVVLFDTLTPYHRPDDLVYLRQGASLLDQLRNRPFADISLINTAESFHFFYIMPVALAVYLFGEHYHSMVALNVALSFICGLFAYAIVNTRYKNQQVARYFFILIVLNPDLLSWTTFFAGKDTWVLLGHLIFIYAFVCIEDGKRAKGVLWMALAVALTINLRFYVPVVMTLLIAMTLSRRTKYWILGLAGLGLVLAPETLRALRSLMTGGVSSLSLDFFALLVAIPRFWLTPRPFLEDDLHGFLRIASMINWALLPFMLIGLYRCALSKDKFSRFLVYYFLAFSLFYGLTAALNGPRQRLQLLFAQMLFLWVGLSYAKLIPVRLRLLPVEQMRPSRTRVGLVALDS
jgi:hypothetical protein